MTVVREQIVESALAYEKLIPAIEKAFCEDLVVPDRVHLDVDNPKANQNSTLLMMPAWQSGHRLGVKLLTVSPENGKFEMPAIQGTYVLFDANKGNPILTIDARKLTAKRTAATSAVASSMLSRDNSKTLLMIGTGALAPELIKAHAAVRPIQRVYVWGRDKRKAEQLCRRLKNKQYTLESVNNINDVIRQADIISCATLTTEPLVHGASLVNGQHLDLVGSYRADQREVDDEAILKSTLFADMTDNAVAEGGDYAIPVSKGLIDKSAVKADLFALCQGEHEGRNNEYEITCFKSVGHALEDLAAACLIEEYLATD